jgi:hypothetical protein
VAYTTAEGRERVLDDLAGAIDDVALALALLGAAYDVLDERAADELEEQLFRSVQLAYGRAQRTHSDFASRHGFPVRRFETPSPGAPSQSANELITRASDASAKADQAIADLQDSMLPIEVGDPELRAGLTAARELLAPVPRRARELGRTVGR